MTTPTSSNERDPPPPGPDAAAERPAHPPEPQPTRVREAFTYAAEAAATPDALEREERDPLSFQRRKQAGLDDAARAAARARFG